MTNTNILTNLPTEKEKKAEKRKNIAITIIMWILIVLFIIFLIATNVAAEWKDSDSKQIAEYEYQINELRKQKEECYNNLDYYESEQAALWFTKPCVEWDEQIMLLREQADNLKAKTYEKGFTTNR